MSIKEHILPKKFIIPINKGIDFVNKIPIKIGEKVLKGQCLNINDNSSSSTIHFPTSGKIVDIVLLSSSYSDKIKELNLILIPDGKDSSINRRLIPNFNYYSPNQLINIIHKSGINELDIFTCLKHKNFINKIKLFIVNVVECNFYSSSNDKLIQEYIHDIIFGLIIIRYIFKPKKIIISIEENKFKSIEILKLILQYYPIGELKIIHNNYNSDKIEKLVKVINGKENFSKETLINDGIFILDVSTILAIKKSIIDGENFIERLITISDQKSKSINIWARFGTPIIHLLNFKNLNICSNKYIVVLDKLFNSYKLLDINKPILKTNTCILITSKKKP